MFSKFENLFKNSDDEQSKNYEEIINNNTLEQLREMHKIQPICKNCNIEPLKDILFKTNDVNKIKFLVDDLGVKTNLNIKLDIAMEEGYESLTKYLISKNALYSRYAKQMAMINGHYSIVLYAETFGKERSSVGIDCVHRKIGKNEIIWSDYISDQYRFY